MTKTIHKTILAIALTIGCYTGIAQTTFEYVYDAAGNRATRNVLTLKSATIGTTQQTDSTQQAASGNKKKAQGKNGATDILGNVTLNLYPNPTAGRVELDISNFADGLNGEILVFDIRGALLFKQANISSKTDIDLYGQPRGTYIIKIMLGDRVSEWKIIKE